MTSRACSTEYRLKHPCGKAAGVLCRICTVLVLFCRGGRLCPPCMTAPYHFVGDGVPSARQRRAVIARSAAPRQSVFLFWGDGFPRQSADWLGMTGSRGGRLCPSHQRRAVAIRPPSTNPPVKITTIPRQILCTYPKCENFAGNGCGWPSKVLYLTHTS